MLDNNRANAVETLMLDPKKHQSSYLYNDPQNRFYQCRLICMEVSTLPRNRYLRLAIDARGELDLRYAPISSIAVVSLPHTPRDDTHSVPHVGRVFAALQADTVLMTCYQEGHYQGMLQWDAASLQHIFEALQPGRSLVFCYGVHLGGDSSWSHLSAVHADYSSAVLLTVPPGSTLKSTWGAMMQYRLRDESWRQLTLEGEEERRARWSDLHPALLARGGCTAGKGGGALLARGEHWWHPHEPGSQRLVQGSREHVPSPSLLHPHGQLHQRRVLGVEHVALDPGHEVLLTA